MTTSTAQAAAVLGKACSLHEAIVVGLRLSPSWTVVDVIVQDEFTHDVVMAPDGASAGDPALVLDCT
ncbi:MAG TPA: hypothetical protein VM734_06590 [Kofleriaceae bacterium]|jgi:hypothetical protein|nr:hypothetical protein [Kofleriaceae bacterium]